MTRLEVTIRRKKFPMGQVEALVDCHFSIGSGEFVALVGPSGAGKTTILNIVGGLDCDYDGEVTVNDRRLTDSAHHPARISYMFQEPRLMPWLTVAENLELILGGAPERVPELLEQVGLEARAQAYPNELSGGMQRRTALARAFAVEPMLLLMDEPFLSLDQPTAARLRELLLHLWWDRRPTVLFVTHSLHEAIAISDRVLFLSDSPGRVIHELAVDLPRPRDVEDRAIEALQLDVLRRHPHILSGRVEADVPGVDGERLNTA